MVFHLSIVSDDVVQEFAKLQVSGNISRAELEKFVVDNFLPIGDELQEANLTDWSER